MGSKTRKVRADELLVAQGLSASRTQAKTLIMSGKVRLGTVVVDKPGRTLSTDSRLTVCEPPRFVSRGAEKLAAFLDHYKISVEGQQILDVGASTGGFTDCLLQRGALAATCVDVGYGQLHSKLRNDPRVTNLERVNARYLLPEHLPHTAYDLITMDLSFISLRKVLPVVWPFLHSDGLLIALVKPQFEANKKEVDKGRGVIRDPDIHKHVLAGIRNFACETLPNCVLFGELPSPLKGVDGNQEFLLGLRKRVEQTS